MTLRQFKKRVFVIEALNAFSTAFYFNYAFFYLRFHFGVGSGGNLLFCSLNGFIYMLSAWYGGRFGQKRGYFIALQIGFVVMALPLLGASLLPTLWGQVGVMIVWTLGLCFTWPNLQALTSERESPRALPPMLGIYNVIWASGSALAYFSGGTIVEMLGWKSIFLLPAAMHVAQLFLSAPLMRTRISELRADESTAPEVTAQPHDRKEAAGFLKLAWIANPFAYIAINTAIPLIPDLAARLHLSPAMAGVFCSVWMFSRLGSFVLLGVWPGWHYRFSLLIGAYVLVIAAFAGFLLLPNLWAILANQILFGLSIGLVYCSSLFYSMDVGEEKGSHGGFHEAAIGAGIFAGPAIGFTALRSFPGHKSGSVWAVSFVLLIGLGVLLFTRRQLRRQS